MAEKSSFQIDNLIIPNHVKEIVKNLTTHHLNQIPSARIANDPYTFDKYEGIGFSSGGSGGSYIYWFTNTFSAAGQGLVLLLYGASGVGKRSTAGKPRAEFFISCFVTV